MGSLVISDTEIWLELGGILAVVLLLPFYMGFLHVELMWAASYAVAGGFGMAAGERVHSDKLAWQPRHLLPDVLLWSGAICGVGGIAYACAWLFI